MASQTSLWLCLLHPVRHCTSERQLNIRTIRLTIRSRPSANRQHSTILRSLLYIRTKDAVDLRSMDETDFCDSSTKSSRGRQTLSPSWCTTLAAGDDSKMSTRVPITSTHVVKPALRSPTVLSLSQMMARPSRL